MTGTLAATLLAVAVGVTSAQTPPEQPMPPRPQPQEKQPQPQEQPQKKHHEHMDEPKPDRAQMFRIEREPLMAMIDTWPEKSREVANTIIEKYGLPDEATPSMLVWHDNKPWKRTIVHKEPVDHNFPMPHQDIVEQVVSYKVPPGMVDELTKFDGSVYFDRTRGELSAKCDKEAANILALNLADDVLQKRKSVEQARTAYANAIKQMLAGKQPKMVTALQFEQPPPQTAASPDRAVIERPVTSERAPTEPVQEGG